MKKHGRKSRRHIKRGGKARRTHRRHTKKGGSMMAGLESLVKTALVPFGLYAAQKAVQHKRK